MHSLQTSATRDLCERHSLAASSSYPIVFVLLIRNVWPWKLIFWHEVRDCDLVCSLTLFSNNTYFHSADNNDALKYSAPKEPKPARAAKPAAVSVPERVAAPSAAASATVPVPAAKAPGPSKVGMFGEHYKLRDHHLLQKPSHTSSYRLWHLLLCACLK